MRHPTVSQALELLACETRETDLLASPDAVRDYLRLLLGDRPHEIFAVVFLDAQHRVIATEEMFRGTLTQTSVYPREVVKEALNRNAAAVILCHNHPSGSPQPSQADQHAESCTGAGRCPSARSFDRDSHGGRELG